MPESGLAGKKQLFGLEDSLFEQKKPLAGLITRREVRAISLAWLSLQPDSVVWDIGAGSAAISIEAARLCPHGQVYAIEKNHQTAELAGNNIAQASCQNLWLVVGLAPESCRDWPAPDSVFIGGSGGQMAHILEFVAGVLKPGGSLVLNLVTLENLQECLKELAIREFEADVTLVQISRSREIMGLTRLEALNPVFIVAATRKDS